LVSKAVGKLNLIKIEGKIGKIMFITIRFGGAEFFGQRLQTDLLILKLLNLSYFTNLKLN